MIAAILIAIAVLVAAVIVRTSKPPTITLLARTSPAEVDSKCAELERVYEQMMNKLAATVANASMTPEENKTMAMYTDQKFTAAVDKVRLWGVRVQEAKADAEKQKNAAPWLDALDGLMKAKAELDEIVLAGLDLDHPVIEPEVEAPTAPQIVETHTEQTETAAGPQVVDAGDGTLPTAADAVHETPVADDHGAHTLAGSDTAGAE